MIFNLFNIFPPEPILVQPAASEVVVVGEVFLRTIGRSA